MCTMNLFNIYIYRKVKQNRITIYQLDQYIHYRNNMQLFKGHLRLTRVHFACVTYTTLRQKNGLEVQTWTKNVPTMVLLEFLIPYMLLADVVSSIAWNLCAYRLEMSKASIMSRYTLTSNFMLHNFLGLSFLC